jgi:integrase
MGTIFRKIVTKPLPEGAKTITRKGEQLAEWLDAKGKRRTAPLTTGRDGSPRIVITAKTYTAKYRDGGGVVQEVATGCRDESAARSMLTELEKRAEKVRGGILTAAEDATIDHRGTPLADHIAAFIDHQRARGLSRRVNDTRSQLRRVANECGFVRLADLDATILERWLLDRKADGMSAGTMNQYRSAWVAFGSWCVRNGRLSGNPLIVLPKADESADRRRTRRALTESELMRLLDVAQRRPLEDRLTVHKGPRKGQKYAKLRPEVERRLERLGRERALIYKTLVLTGLRKGELASLTAGQLDLDAPMPCLVLRAADEKNREGSTMPLRADLAADLRQWLAEKAEVVQEAAREAPAVPFDSEVQKRDQRILGNAAGREGQSCLPLTRFPFGLPADTRLFTVPTGLVRILDRDLRLAGIPKMDERGRTVDVHAIRHTFGTLLSKGGVAPRTAQAAMRHSTIDLTMNVYTDPKLLDVAGAMDALPALPLGDGGQQSTNVLSATGTDDSTPCQFAPGFAPTTGKSSVLQSILDKVTSEVAEIRQGDAIAASACSVKRKDSLTTAVNESRKWAALDSNQRLPPCEIGTIGAAEKQRCSCLAASYGEERRWSSCRKPSQTVAICRGTNAVHGAKTVQNGTGFVGGEGRGR